jgi:ABC-type antimicrobial peptide transport system permease subunit
MAMPQGPISRTFNALKKDPLGMTGFVLVSLILFLTLFAVWLAPHDPLEVNIHDRLSSRPPHTGWARTNLAAISFHAYCLAARSPSRFPWSPFPHPWPSAWYWE